MTRDQLATLLADLITRRVITEADAERIIMLHDAGEFSPEDLPLEAQPKDDTNDWVLALALVLLLVNGNTTQRLSMAKRRLARNQLRVLFEANTLQLARGVTGGSMTVATWQGQMWEELASYTRQMAIAGAGRLPSGTTLALAEARLAEQWPYLQRFATEIGARGILGRPMSTAAIAARSRLYGGMAWGAYFVGQGDDAAWGWVEQWITRDDGKVCPNCAPRHERYFLPGRGPMPGHDCLGSCRCRRDPAYDPQVYIELGGRRAA